MIKFWDCDWLACLIERVICLLKLEKVGILNIEETESIDELRIGIQKQKKNLKISAAGQSAPGFAAPRFGGFVCLKIV